MKSPHLLRVSPSPEPFAPLLRAAAEAGLRIGWLEIAAVPPEPLPPTLAAAAGAGAHRAVAAAPGRSVAVKPLRGAPVLKDLLREHFLGCALVLIAGDPSVPLPLLQRVGDDAWELTPPSAAPLQLTTADAIAALRRPHPW
ncbi:MAG TPA: hypothetical protein VHR45_13325 [Thermoanaerobaculia bacterium]|nr:hypothetical protein [Thermoanaerobaculia bacterium]